MLLAILIIITLVVSSTYLYETNTETCKNVLVSGGAGNVDIVFLADNYQNIFDFKSDVNHYVDRNGIYNGLLSVEPFKSNWYRLNFYLVEELNDLDCLTGKDYLLCNQNKAKSAASSCPHDFIVVLSQQNPFDSSANLRSSAYIGVATINTADNRLVLTHEFGHLFGGLADEYLTGDENVDAPNCDVVTCPKWYGLFDGIGCFKECTSADMYRSTRNSIMRDYTKTNEFGPLNENILTRRFL